jgi:hypothetical protein
MPRKNKTEATPAIERLLATDHGTVTVSVRMNLLNIDQDERDLVFGIIDMMNEWERRVRERGGTSSPESGEKLAPDANRT